jgi:hypothetical protein
MQLLIKHQCELSLTVAELAVVNVLPKEEEKK